MKKLAALALVAVLYVNRGILASYFAPPSVAEGDVVLYATEWCGYCRKAREFLQESRIPYVEHDIEKSPDARRRYRELGGSGVPLLHVKGKIIRGYNPDAILDALR